MAAWLNEVVVRAVTSVSYDNVCKTTYLLSKKIELCDYEANQTIKTHPDQEIQNTESKVPKSKIHFYMSVRIPNWAPVDFSFSGCASRDHWQSIYRK